MSAPSRKPPTAFGRVWKTPLILAGATTFGLLSALLGTGVWRWFAWVALSVPIGVALRFGCRSRRSE